VPDIVPASLFPQANSLDQMMKPLALRLIGPAVGGWVIGTWGAGVGFAMDAATFAVSAGSLLMMRKRPAHTTTDAKSIVGELRAGFSFVKSHVWLWGTFAAAAIAYLLFMGPAEVLLPYIVKEEMNSSAADLGLVFAVGGVGAILSAVIMGSRSLPRRRILFIYAAWTLSTLAVAGYGLARVPWHLMVASFAFNFLESAGTIVWVTLKQRLVPAALLGRVSSLDWLISIGLVPVSFALTGPISEVVGARATLAGAGLLGAVVTFGAFFLPGMRAAERSTDASAAGEPSRLRRVDAPV
jgi:hypothetical protein